MADLQSVVELIFRGTDEVTQTANKVGKSLQDLNNSVGDITEPFAKLSDKLAIVQAAFIAVAGVIGGLAYNESVKFQSSLLDLQKQLDDSEGKARQFADAINEVALKYGQNANQVATATADFKAAGFSISDSLTLVQSALDLSIAGGVNFDQAVKIINGSLAGFQVANEDAISVSKRFSDVINKTADLTKSSFTELAQGFSDLSPVAKLAGLSFEDTAALLSKVIDVFGSGSEAANALGSSFVNLRNPTEAMAAQMIDLGVKFDSAGKPIGTIKELLDTIVPNFIKLTNEQQSSAAATLFGKEQYDKMIPVLTAWNDTMKLSAQITKEAGGSIDKEVNLRLQSAQQIIASTNESFRQLLTSLGDKFEVNTTGVISSLGALAIEFKKTIEAGSLDPLFELLNPQLAELENIFRTVARNLPDALSQVDFQPLVNSLKALGEQGKAAFEALFGDIDISTPDKLAESIQRVVDAISGIVRITAGELGGLKPFLEGINKLATAFKDATPEAQGFIGTIIGFGSGLNTATGFLDTALLSFIAFGSKVTPALAALKAEALLAAAAITGPAGIAVALGVAAGAIAQFLIPADKLADWSWPDWLAGYEGASAGTAAADIADGFVALKNRVDEWIGTSKELENNAPSTIKVTSFDGAISEIARYEQSIRDADKEYTDLVNFLAKPVPVSSWDGILAQLNKIDEKTKDANDSTKKYIGTLEGLPELKLPDNVKVEQYRTNIEGVVAANGALVTSYSSIDGKTVKATGAFAAVSTAAEDNAKKVEKATKEADSFRIKMEEIASNERIKNIEAFVTLNVANLEAQTKQVEAAFSSINETISGTGDLLGSLFGSLGSADTYTKLQITEQIDLENKRREAALELQKQLTKATIEKIQAETRRIERGDALITVEAAGLEPHLEAIWFQIMKYIRVRVNSDAEQFLLGSV
ncbi:MAG: phage tail tape measure protein [Vampirovibrionales bacterium]|nr:phage tail tape measure protein [Vampirovibrionales bacterium]